MRYVIRLLVLAIVVALVGGVVWLAMTEPEPQRQEMEKVISNDRFDL